MQYPTPPTSTPIATLRPDFPEEFGALDLLKKSISDHEATAKKAIREIFPPLTKVEDIPALAKFLAIPDQIVYFERLSKDQKSVMIAVHFTATICAFSTPKPMWTDLVEMVRAKLGHGPGLLPFQMEAAPNEDLAAVPFPAKILVHNRRTGTLHLEDMGQLSSFLQKRMTWTAPKT